MYPFPTCNSADILAHIHWHLLKANHAINDACYIRYEEPESGRFKRSHYELTELGREVNHDPIHWWIFWKTKDVNSLRLKTEEALSAAETLHRSMQQFRIRSGSYESIVRQISDFTDSHLSNLRKILDYISHLSGLDPMAPAILFTYTVWGTTQRHERSVDGDFLDFSKETVSVTTDLIEAIYALRFYHQPHMIDQIRSQLSYELYEKSSKDPESLESQSPSVDESEVLAQLAAEVRSGMAVYFRELRDSFHAVMNEIEAYFNSNRLAVSRKFWEDLILKCIRTQESENELWDLKETLQVFCVREPKAKLKESVKFAERVAGFANSSGGVFIIGVSDKPRKLIGFPSSEIEDRIKHVTEILDKHINTGRSYYKINQVGLFHESVMKYCIVIAVAQTKDVLTVDDDTGHFSVPVRSASGLAHQTLREVTQSKQSVQVENFNYIERLREFIQTPTG